jgi:hypothetical protein
MKTLRPERGPQPGSSSSPAQRPEPGSIEKAVRDELNSIMALMGERWLGGPWDPQADLRVHTKAVLESKIAPSAQALKEKFEYWLRSGLASGPVQMLMYVWRECWELWDRCLAYRTLRAVEKAAADFIADASALGPDGWEMDALRAVGDAMKLLLADADVYKHINLSSVHGLSSAANKASGTTGKILDEINSILGAIGPWSGQPGEGSDQIIGNLREIQAAAQDIQKLYDVIARAAQALILFESWLATAPRLGSAGPFPHAVGSPDSHAAQTLRTSIEDAITHVRRSQESIDDPIRSECEPWEQLLIEVRNIVDPRREFRASRSLFRNASRSVAVIPSRLKRTEKNP